MQTAQPTLSTWQRPSSATLPNSGWLAYLRGLSLTAYLFSLLFGFWFISDWSTQQELRAEGFDLKRYFAFGMGAALLAHLTLGVPTWFNAALQMASTWVGALFTAFCCWMVLLSPISVIGFTSALYAGATWVTALMLWLFWTSNYRVARRMLVVACWVQFAWWFILLAKHGMPFGIGFNIGDINRNVTGTSALAAMLCGLFAPNRYLRWAAVAATVFFTTLVTSRGSIVALSVFILVYYTLHVGVFRSAAHFGAFAVLVALIVLAVPEFRVAVVEKVFRLHDRARGIGSGFTGRTEMWKEGIDWFWKNPVFGYGFRSASEDRRFGGVHSAYIKIFLEAGFIGGFLMIGAMIVDTVRRARVALRLRTLRPTDMPGINIAESIRLNSIACGTMCLTLTMWVYDQYYVNIGSPISVMLFLMLMAPTYVTTQGVMLRR
jgi:O-antigen ligase